MFIKLLCLGILSASVLSIPISHPNQTQQPTGVIRFNKIAIWRLRVSWHATNSQKEVIGGPQDSSTQTTTVTGDVSCQVDLKLIKTKDSNSDYYLWETADGSKPTGSMSYSAEEKHEGHSKDSGDAWLKTTASASGIANGSARLTIDVSQKRLQLNAFSESNEGPFEMSTSQGLKETGKTGLVLSTGSSDVDAKLPDSGLIITSSSAAQVQGPTLGLGLKKVDMTWSLMPWKDEAPSEASFQFDDKDWMPDPATPCGLTIKWKGKAEEIRVKLFEISHEPGTCLNSPETGDEDDLLIKAQGKWAVGHEGSGSSSAYNAALALPKDAPNSAHLEIAATDYGGWSKIKIDVLVDGEWKHADETSIGKPTVNIPYDLDGNHIADYYEKRYDVKGLAPNEDKDDIPIADGNHSGDGLTIYEEYRGFMVNGKHIRTDPKIKDLFLSDQTGGMASAGCQLFHSITQIAIHDKLTAAELSDSRVINRNHKDGPHTVDQHGIPIIMGAADSDAEAISASANGEFGPPVMTTHINLPTGGQYSRQSGAQNKATEDNISTVAHELGHCVGIKHHGSGVFYALWFIWKDKDGNPHIHECGFDPGTGKAKDEITEIHVFRESDGSEVIGSLDGIGSTDPVSKGKRILVAQRPSPYTGQEDCVMRYTDPDAYIAPSKAIDVRYIPGPTTWVKRDTLCVSPQGTGINAKDHKPWPRYGDATNGNCLSQIVVSDKYAKH